MTPPSTDKKPATSAKGGRRKRAEPPVNAAEAAATQRRYRVTGGIFLIALAAIVLPMLFDLEPPALEPLPDVSAADALPELAPLPPEDTDTSFIDEAQALSDQIDPDGYLVDGGQRFGEPTLSESEGEPSADGSASKASAAWAVQVAAFSDRDNARAFRDRLKADGFAAFISSVKRSGSELHRVAVGPMVNRNDADRERGQLARRYDVEAIIVGFQA